MNFDDLEQLKRDLHSVYEDHKKDIVGTGELAISAMVKDVLDVLGDMEDRYNALVKRNADLSSSYAVETQLYVDERNHTRELTESIKTMPHWISVADGLPTEDGEYQVVYKHRNGALVVSVDEWDCTCQDWMDSTDKVTVVCWAELLPIDGLQIK